MDIRRAAQRSKDYPERLRHIASPPKALYCTGQALTELIKRPTLAVVGSRNPTTYGRQVTIELVGRLSEQGIVIVSGLALGIDAIAHQTCLEAQGLTIAVLPSSLDLIYPATNQRLAGRIVEQDGVLVSEYEVGEFAFKANFIARNRLIAGLADAVLITEAAEKSGSLHTARFALEQGKEVLAVPGAITAPNSIGTNNLIKAGATVVTGYEDVLEALKLSEHQTASHLVKGRNAHEQGVLDLMLQGISDGDELLVQSELSTTDFNRVLTMLEIGGKIRSIGANHWTIK